MMLKPFFGHPCLSKQSWEIMSILFPNVNSFVLKAMDVHLKHRCLESNLKLSLN